MSPASRNTGRQGRQDHKARLALRAQRASGGKPPAPTDEPLSLPDAAEALEELPGATALALADQDFDGDEDSELGDGELLASDGGVRIVVAATARLDKVLADTLPELSRTRLQQLIRAGDVTVDGAVATVPSLKVIEGASIGLVVPEALPATPLAEPIPLDIAYEDDDVVVLDKPAGMVVHPAAGHHTGTLVNALLSHCGSSLSGIGGVRRPGIVHRLDKDTTGLMVVAKHDKAHAELSRQFADHGRTGPLERAYLALVWGALPAAQITIDKPLARSTRNREKIAVTQDGSGREAITHVTVERCWPSSGEPVVSLVRCHLETGRTHQIRVHLASIGHPLLGDPLYGGGFKTKAARLPLAAQQALDAIGRQALHAGLLGFAHPVTGAEMEFESEPPEDFDRLVSALDGEW